MRVLCVNCGSSSLKFSLREVEAEQQRVLAAGEIERVGGQSRYELAVSGKQPIEGSVEAPNHEAAIRVTLDLLTQRGMLDGLDAVAHRVVHSGPHLTGPTRLDEATLALIEEATELAPLHNGPALAAIKAARAALPDTPSVAVFDTSFYADLPASAATYAIPRELAAKYAIRRYGFHGLAHRYMLEHYATKTSSAGAHRVVSLQLGSGCSATASLDGRPVDTSMGFTPLEGLVMGTRSGDLDPAIALYIAGKEGMSPAQVDELLNRKSGLLGLSGRSADLRDLESAGKEGDANAALAIDVFCHRLVKYVGAYAAALGGLDAVLFGGGIGENSASVRRRVCDAMAWAGLQLDAAANDAAEPRTHRLATPASRIDAWVIAVDEEEVMAHDAAALLA